MMKNWENNGTEEIGLVTPTPECIIGKLMGCCLVVSSPHMDQCWFPIRKVLFPSLKSYFTASIQNFGSVELCWKLYFYNYYNTPKGPEGRWVNMMAYWLRDLIDKVFYGWNARLRIEWKFYFVLKYAYRWKYVLYALRVDVLWGTVITQY